jgi:hypothetical protein
VLTYGIIYLFFFLEGKTVGEAPTVVLYYYLKKQLYIGTQDPKERKGIKKLNSQAWAMARIIYLSMIIYLVILISGSPVYN